MAELGDLYAILGVPRDATAEQIKRAYRKLARELHPDTNPDPGAEERFKQVTVAYEILSDPERRLSYDTYGDPRGPQMGGMGNAGGFEGGFGDLFDMFFSQMGAQQGRRRGPHEGPDVEATLGLTLAEAAFGANRELTLRVPVPCSACQASGAEPGTSPERCGDCQGTGEVRRVRQSILGQMVTASPCGRCGGYGEVLASPCSQCRGDGRVTEERRLTVEVPPGVESGTTLRLAGRGASGPRGGPAGSLFVHLEVVPDPRFERVGDDLHTMIHVSSAQAALGTEVEVSTLEDPLSVRIEAGTQSGAVLKQRHHGIPHLHGRGRGDLFVHVQVDTPVELSEREAELYAELAELRGELIVPDAQHKGLLGRIRSAFS
jgi:molecular chaperone DnaJ